MKQKLLDLSRNIFFGSIIIYLLALILRFFDLDTGISLEIIFKIILIAFLASAVIPTGVFFKDFKKNSKKLTKGLASFLGKIKVFVGNFVQFWFVKWLISPVGLFLLGLGLSLFAIFYGQNNSILVLNEKKNVDSFLVYKAIPLQAKESVTASFRGDENNLGIVAVRFQTFDRINEDVLEFRIKEAGQEGWYYSNYYNTDQFQPEQLFPFGFPPIKDSKGKDFIFEIESLYGATQSAVAISREYPVFETKYKFDKRKMFSNRGELPSFLLKKMTNTFSDYSYLMAVVVFFLPFLVYLTSQIFHRKLFREVNNRFAFYLLVYLILQVYIQLSRLLLEYVNIELLADGYLKIASDFLLVLVLLFGFLSALFTKASF